MKNELFNELEWDSTESTPRLIFFTLITLGIYNAFYIERQSIIFNSYFDDNQVSKLFLLVLYPVVGLSAIFNFFSFIDLNNEGLSQINRVIGYLSWGMITIWAFKLRKTINKAFSYLRGEKEYFKARYTFLFNLFYINYKINKFNEQSETTESLEKFNT